MALTLDGTAGITFPSGSGTQAAQSKVLQVVNATYSTQTTTGSSTFSDTGLTASITPLFSTSKILVIVDQCGCCKADNQTRLMLQLVRASTVLYKIEDSGGYTGTTTPNFFGSVSTNYLDSPSTTSSVTYKTQFASYSNVITAGVQQNGATSTITLMEIAA